MCDREAGYNRTVIDVFSGMELGGLCMNCEKDEFGNSLQYGASNGEGQCNYCERDGQIRLPRYVPRTERRDNITLVKSSIEESDSVPSLCDEHFHEIVRRRNDRKVTL